MNKAVFTSLIETQKWPLDLTSYDRSPKFLRKEAELLANDLNQLKVGTENATQFGWTIRSKLKLPRLVSPICDALNYLKVRRQDEAKVIYAMMTEMNDIGLPYWGWDEKTWTRAIVEGTRDCEKRYRTAASVRKNLFLLAYIFSGFTAFESLPLCPIKAAADALIGEKHCDLVMERFLPFLKQRNYSKGASRNLRRSVSHLMLETYSTSLENVTAAQLANHFHNTRNHLHRAGIRIISAVLFNKSYENTSVPKFRDLTLQAQSDAIEDKSEWEKWCDKWYQFSLATRRTRRSTYYHILRIGKWLNDTHPNIVSPKEWTRTTVAECISAINQMQTGQNLLNEKGRLRDAKPLSARSKKAFITALRRFFIDLQSWEWIDKKFNPRNALSVPKSVSVLIQPNPKPIDEISYKRMLVAALSLSVNDLIRKPRYPIEMLRAASIVLMLCGLRANEIIRLELDCIQVPTKKTQSDPSNDIDLSDQVCFLNIPANKTSKPFTKPVEALVGEIIAKWKEVRPTEPDMIDHKTNRYVQFLFSYRGKVMTANHLNTILITTLCNKAGIPIKDSQGKISCHRLRSTVATMLVNTRNPMSILELKEWLGHKTLTMSQHYVKRQPTKLLEAYEEAREVREKTRSIDVLIDQEVVESGNAVNGEAWKYYDLVHGYCTYDFFAMCRHRNACAKCPHYVAKQSSKSNLVEAKENLLRLKETVELSREELSVITEDIDAITSQIEQLTGSDNNVGFISLTDIQ